MTSARFWCISRDGNPEAYRMYRRHYSAKKNPRPKLRQFVGPGERLVLKGFFCKALFVWRKFIDDSGQRGVYCSVFRNESSHLSSMMIAEAMYLAWDRWPNSRLYTYINSSQVTSSNPGYCFKKAGWHFCGKTKKGLHILEAFPNL